MFGGYFPAGEYQYGGVALEYPGNRLRSFNTQIDPVIFDGGNRGLGNARGLGQFILAHILEFANDSNGFSDGDINPFFAGLNSLISLLPVIVWRHINDIDEHFRGLDLVDDPVFLSQSR